MINHKEEQVKKEDKESKNKNKELLYNETMIWKMMLFLNRQM